VLVLNEDDRYLRQLGERAHARVEAQERRHQENIDASFFFAFDEPPPPKIDGTPDRPEPATVERLLEGASKAYDEYGQRLWGRLIANEIVNPGRVSPRAIALLQSMTSDEAQLFQKACGFAFTEPNLFLCWDRDLFSKASGLPYAAVLTLEEAGLIRPDSTLRFAHWPGREGSFAKVAVLRHFENYIAIKRVAAGATDFPLGAHIFTKAGADLFPLVPQQGDPAFLRELLRWPGVRVFDRHPTPQEITNLLVAEVPPQNPPT
jgi:hypothetical protein